MARNLARSSSGWDSSSASASTLALKSCQDSSRLTYRSSGSDPPCGAEAVTAGGAEGTARNCWTGLSSGWSLCSAGPVSSVLTSALFLKTAVVADTPPVPLSSLFALPSRTSRSWLSGREKFTVTPYSAAIAHGRPACRGFSPLPLDYHASPLAQTQRARPREIGRGVDIPAQRRGGDTERHRTRFGVRSSGTYAETGPEHTAG